MCQWGKNMSSDKQELRARRKLRVRKKISGTAERPRLSIYRSSKHIYAQLIDDVAGKTLTSIHSYDLEANKRANKAVCSDLGKRLAEKCKTMNIVKIVFDKNGFTYHGRLKSFADGAREAGLEF